MGFGTFFAGPLSEMFGRHKFAIGGSVLFILGALLIARSRNLETRLVARTLQGVGAAGPRVIALAITRDLFKGRQMARVVSFLMIVFSLVAVIAPTMGAAISWAFGWRTVYLTFVVFSLISVFWLILRQPETLLPEARRPFRAKEICRGIKDGFRKPSGCPRNRFSIKASIKTQTLHLGSACVPPSPPPQAC